MVILLSVDGFVQALSTNVSMLFSIVLFCFIISLWRWGLKLGLRICPARCSVHVASFLSSFLPSWPPFLRSLLCICGGVHLCRSEDSLQDLSLLPLFRFWGSTQHKLSGRAASIFTCWAVFPPSSYPDIKRNFFEVVVDNSKIFYSGRVLARKEIPFPNFRVLHVAG